MQLAIHEWHWSDHIFNSGISVREAFLISHTCLFVSYLFRDFHRVRWLSGLCRHTTQSWEPLILPLFLMLTTVKGMWVSINLKVVTKKNWSYMTWHIVNGAVYVKKPWTCFCRPSDLFMTKQLCCSRLASLSCPILQLDVLWLLTLLGQQHRGDL